MVIAALIDVNGDIHLGPLPECESRRGFEHVTLNGIESRRLGIFFTMQGKSNPTAINMANMLRDKYSTSTAALGGRGTAYLYDDQEDITESSLISIQKFIHRKLQRGDVKNETRRKKRELRQLRKLKRLMTTHECAECGKCDGVSVHGDKMNITPRLLKCGACKVAHYCSQTCQKKHWREHKKVCKTK